MKKIFAALAVIAATFAICACASNEPKPDYDKVRTDADAAYQDVKDDAE